MLSPPVLGVQCSPRAAWMGQAGFVLLGGICRAAVEENSRGDRRGDFCFFLLAQRFFSHVFAVCLLVFNEGKKSFFFLAVSIECAVGFETLAWKNAQVEQDTCKQQSPAHFSD